jgi:hypothetical protein
VDLHGLLEIFDLHILQWPHPHNARVIDQNVDRAEPLRDGVNDTLDGLPVANIRRKYEDVPTPALDLGFRVFKLFQIAGTERDSRPGVRESFGDLQAEAA